MQFASFAERAVPIFAIAGLMVAAAIVRGAPAQIPANAVTLGPVEIGPPVRHAPYSADAITETTQTLGDGTRITRRSTTRIYRDSRGWTRREVTMGDIAGLAISGAPLSAITITDPDSRRTYVIAADGKATAIEPPAPGRPMGSGVPAGAGAPVPTPTFQQRGAAGGPPSEVSLGTRDIEGLRAEGTRRTTIIPAGAVGNDRPIESLNERWFSPELGVVLLRRLVDPRFGETVFTLTNIKRTEPPASLFAVQ
jgi:hypothetical protein